MAKRSGGGSEPDIPGIRDLSGIGRGATSSVYRGHDDELNRWVAVKVFLADDPDDPARKRFRREREITANLGKHPYVVQVLGTGFTKSGLPYVVMELFEQGSIADRIRAVGAFSVAETLDIGIKIADAVGAAHRAGVLHRDIKPQNVLLSEYGPALADFGIARSATNLEWSQSLEQITPMHAAPEILVGGPPTPEADVYSLGSTLYTMLAGRPPFAGPTGESILRYQIRVASDPVPPLARADVPEAVLAVLTKALAKDPSDRYPTPMALRDALLALQRGSAPPAEAPTSVWAPGGTVEPSVSDDLPTVSRGREIPPDDANKGSEAAADQAWAPQVEPVAQSSAPVGPTPLAAWSDDLGPLGSIPFDGDPSPTLFRGRPSVPNEAPLPSTSHRSKRAPALIGGGIAVILLIALVGVLIGRGHNVPKTIHVPSTIPITTKGRPVDLHATVGTDGSSALLQWKPGSREQDYYIVLKVPESTRATVAGRVLASQALQFPLTRLDPTAPYCFVVLADIGNNEREAPSCTCIRNGTIAPNTSLSHLTCSSS
jgi:serine/threonine-protein kinase PknK